jgi:hypothetical protein
MCCSLDKPLSEVYISSVLLWRDDAKGCCDTIGRRFVTELAIVTIAIPVALIELAVRAIFHTLHALVFIAHLPFCCCIKVSWLPCNLLTQTITTTIGLLFALVLQPILPAQKTRTPYT